MKNQLFIGIILAAFLINFNDVLTGEHAGWINMLVTVLYLIFWIFFVLYRRGSRHFMIFTVIWGGLHAVFGLNLLVNRIEDSLIDTSIVVSVIMDIPLYGLESIFPNNYIVLDVVGTIFGGILFIIGCIFFVKSFKKEV